MPGSPSSAEGHVVHLLQRWDDAAPAGLRIKPKLRVQAQVALIVMLILAAALGIAGILMLWTTPTPGWWFSLLFTVMIGGLVVAVWAVFFTALRSGAERERASARWIETFDAVRSAPGVVVERHVNTIEDGTVAAFELTVRTEQGVTVAGTWRPRSTRPLLQPQVPGVGSSVRVWSIPDAAATDPLVIESLDPTVVAGAAGMSADRYAD